MRPEQGERGLWYVATVGLATEEAAQAYIDRGMAHYATPSAPSKKSQTTLFATVAGVLALAIVAAVGWYRLSYMSPGQVQLREAKDALHAAQMEQIKMQRLARGFVEGQLKDPSSAQFRNQQGLCGEVNAKNAFGAFTGFRRFVAKSERLVIMEGGGLLGDKEFADLWRQAC